MQFRKKWKEIVVLATVFGLAFVSLGLAGQHPNGWVYPAGSASRNTTSGYGDWHGYPKHIGIDYMRVVGTPVYAIGHGVIEDYSTTLPGYGSQCGVNGSAVLVRYTAQGHDGFARMFYAVYGHVYLDSSLAIGDIVEKGDIIGHVHNYYGDGDGNKVCTDSWPHLHFGIRPDKIDPDKQFRGVASKNLSKIFLLKYV